MRNIIVVGAFLFVSNVSFSKNSIHPIDSSFGVVDSISIEYFDATNVVNYFVTFNKHTIKVSSDHFRNKVFNNSDTINMMINFVEPLFISGREKTEVGRSYSSKLVYTGSNIIRIRLFDKNVNYLTHEIHYFPLSGDIEFSDKFLEFSRFLMGLIRDRK
jgi:hypothetical protein